MKKITALLLVAILTIAMFAACASPAPAPAPAAPAPAAPGAAPAAPAQADLQTITAVSVGMQFGVNWWDALEWETDIWGQRLAESDRGFRLENNYFGPTSRDSALQLQVIADAIALDPDILFVVPIAAESVDAQLAPVKARGTKVISHQGPEMTNVHFNVESFRPQDFAVYMADQIVYHGGPGGNIAILVGTLSEQFHVGVATGLYENFRDRHPGWVSITGTNWIESINAENAYAVAVQLMQQHPDLDAMFVCSASAFVSVARAVENLGRADDIQLFTMASAQLSEDAWRAGTVTLSAFWYAGHVAAAAYEIGLRLIEGRTINTGDDLGIPGFGSIIVEGRNVFGDGWIEVNADNWQQVMVDFPV